MDFKHLFKVLVSHPAVREDSYGGNQLRRTIQAVEARGLQVLAVAGREETLLALDGEAGIGCMVLGWEDGDDQATREVVVSIKDHGFDYPIFLWTGSKGLQDLPLGGFAQIRGMMMPQEESAEINARYIERALGEYAQSIRPPFMASMVDYVEQGHQKWLCPGHDGGTFFKKSPAGRLFVDYLGEHFFRFDFNFVPDLGDIYGKTGAFREAEERAAEVFGAERTYFVLNGTSSTNKMVTGSLLKSGDLVLYDRNNHKSIVQGALLLAGAIPVFLACDRNPYGMVGPVAWDELDEGRIRERIRANPLVQDPMAWKRERPFRLMVIENCTYDGTVYDVRAILDKVGHLCDYILFDEAWGGFLKFHPLYAGRFAMGLENLLPADPGIFASHSTHKQLAGLSQASQFHVKDAHLGEQPRRTDHRRINEVFSMYTSTSPFYPMYASLDVGAQMMKGQQGRKLWRDTLDLAVDIRKQLRRLARTYETSSTPLRDRWFFDPFVPWFVEYEGEAVPWEEVPTEVLTHTPAHWAFRPGEAWHGYTRVEGERAMLDPSKLMILTPGIDRRTGQYQGFGVPAPVLGAFTRSRGVDHEKTDLNLILFLVTPGIERGKSVTLLAELCAFKRLVDRDAPVLEALPFLRQQYPGHYDRMTLRGLCQALHDVYRAWDAKTLQKHLFHEDHLPEAAMTPREAHERFVAGDTDYVSLDEVEGRVAATLALVYPPGVAVVVQGERYGERTRSLVKYFRMFEEIENRFPGFENEVQGVFRERDEAGRIRYFTYVVKEDKVPERP